MTYFVTVKEKPENCEDCVFNCVNRHLGCPFKELPPKVPVLEDEKPTYKSFREAWNTLIQSLEDNAH